MANLTRSLVLLGALLAFSVAAYTSDRPDIEPILASLPKTAKQDVVIIEGDVHKTKTVDRLELLVNDQSAFTAPNPDSLDHLAMRVAITLRPGNNVVTIRAVFTSMRSERWSTNVFRVPDDAVTRYALLIGSTTSSDELALLTTLRATLVAGGVPNDNISTLGRYTDLSKHLAVIAKKAGSKDQVLIYYLGRGMLFRATGEPILGIVDQEVSESTGVLLTDLLRRVAAFDLPSVSLFVDTTFEQPGNRKDLYRDSSGTSAFANAERMGVPWLRTVKFRTNVEIAISNFLNDGSGARPGDLTRAFLSSLHSSAVPTGPCRTLSAVIAAMERPTFPDNASSTIRPLYFAENLTTPSFCFGGSARNADSLSVSATVVPYGTSQNRAYRVSAEIPSRLPANWTEIFVDGVLLKHRSVGIARSDTNAFFTVTHRLPLFPGRHLIEVRAGAGNTILGSNSAELVVASSSTLHSSSSEALGAALLEPREADSVTTDGLANLDFVVEDKQKGGVEFELRNNGVVVVKGRDLRIHRSQKLEVSLQIPLSLGSNNIVVEVARNGRYGQARTLITRKPQQSLRAVIVGTDTYQSPDLPARPSSRADALLIKDTLLKYTEVFPAQVTLLTGAGATRAAIRNSIANSVSTAPSDPFPYGGTNDETLFLYFSGLGATVGDTLSPIRCILPYDTNPADLAQTCISTTEIDQLLDSSNRSVILFDTSYDGLAGPQTSPTERHRLVSRTFQSFFSNNATWRLSSGIDKNNRLFIVGSGTNSPSLEDSELQHGLFTLALAQAVRIGLADQAAGAKSFQELSLSDAYAVARNQTAALTDKQQIPVIKGALSHPFTFTKISVSDLERQADATLSSSQHDVESLRSPDAARLQHASDLLSKVLAISPEDSEAKQDAAKVLLFQGNSRGASQLVDAAIASIRSTIDQTLQPELPKWLMLSAQIKMREGDLKGAIEDCTIAASSSTSLKPAFLLAELYAATLQYDKSLKVLRELLDDFGTRAGGENLTDQEWGRATVWTYVCLRRIDIHTNPKATLRRHAATNRQWALLFRVLLGNERADDLLSHGDRPDTTLNPDLEETWSHLVANYLIDPEAFERELRSFRENNLIFDRKDQKAFDCLMHFYLGINALFGGKIDIARQEFTAAVNTAQTQYPEYWTATAELLQLR
jgi:uncharacterized caspase-like protein